MHYLKTMISVDETMAGLAFLRRYAPDELRPYLEETEQRIQKDIREAKILSVRQRSVDDLEISVRLANILHREGCRTIGEAEKLLRRVANWQKPNWGLRMQRELTAILREVLQ